MTVLERIEKYSRECINQTIPACQKNVWACQRFLRDVELWKSADGNFPYIWNEVEAARYIDTWMPLFNHSKGPLAGLPKIAEPIECFIFGQIYGWRHKDDGTRRFRIAYWQVARKNAKSQDMAIMGLYEMSLFGEPCAEVIVAATKRDQTKYVWGEADYIYRRANKEKLRTATFKTSYGEIKHERSGSVFIRLSEDDKKKGDGANPQCGILDEYHAHESTEYYDLLTSGMKTRKQPLLFIISTAGFDLNHPCYKSEYQYATKVLNPAIDVTNERYFALINELDKDENGQLIDNIRDERSWYKANPILAKTKEGRESITAEMRLAIDKPEKMRDFLTKTLNVWVNQRDSGYMQVDRWVQCSNVIPDLAGAFCYVGVDLSAKHDLTSVAFEFFHEDKYIIFSHSFMPSERFTEKMQEDRTRYDLWEDAGWLTVTAGASVDYRTVVAYIVDRAKESGWNIEEICIDPWNKSQIQINFEEHGLKVSDIIQGIKTLSEPTKHFRDMVYQKRVIHDGSPVLTWAVGNAIADVIDRNENILLSKKKSRERIDPIAAVINAHVKAMIAGQTIGYNQTGMRSL